MLKDWFYYTRGERRVIILLLLVLLVLVTLVVMEQPSEDDFRFENNTMALADSLAGKIRESEKKYRRDSSSYRRTYPKRPSYDIKSGSYDKNEKRNYAKTEKSLVDTTSRRYIPKYKKQEKFPEGTIVDVNTADTATLKKIPGIGSVISRNIVRYRERLGGFHSVAQLLEVRYFDASLLKWFEAGNGVFRKLKVNSDEIDLLKSHPYMGYKKAKAIADYRIRRGRIKGLSQISFLKEFSEKDLENLKYYLDFD